MDDAVRAEVRRVPMSVADVVAVRQEYVIEAAHRLDVVRQVLGEAGRVHHPILIVPAHEITVSPERGAVVISVNEDVVR